MLDIQNKAKEVRLYKNGLVYNKNHGKMYKMKKYAEIEFFNGNIIKLDIEAGADITNCDYLVIKDKGKLVKEIFRSNLL